MAHTAKKCYDRSLDNLIVWIQYLNPMSKNTMEHRITLATNLPVSWRDIEVILLDICCCFYLALCLGFTCNKWQAE